MSVIQQKQKYSERAKRGYAAADTNSHARTPKSAVLGNTMLGASADLNEELVVFDHIVTLLLGRCEISFCATAAFTETTGPFEKL